MSAPPKTQPQAIEAEREILGTMMLSQDAAAIAISQIKPEHFYDRRHQLMMRGMSELFSRGENVDVVTLINWMSQQRVEVAPLTSYVAEMLEVIPIVSAVSGKCRIVKEKAKARGLIELAMTTLDRCYHSDPVEEVTEDFGTRFFKLTADDAKASSRLGEILPGVISEVSEIKRSGHIQGITTGYEELDKRWNGLAPSKLIVLAARPAMGKELTLCSKVLGCDGTFKLMGDIMVGDKVASVDGKDSFVTGVFPQGIKPVYRVTFSDGRSVKAGLDHQWQVMFREWDGPRILTTRELIGKIKIKRYQKRVSIPNHSGDFGEDKNLLVHPYLMGVLLGDGGLSGSSVKITTSHSHIIEKIKPMLLDASLVKDQKITYRISTPKGFCNKLHSSLKEMGLLGLKSHEKFIPDRYLSATKESRLELLRGLIDTDGTVEKTGAMTYTSTSIKLAKQTQSIARSLGASCSMRERVTEYSYKGEKKKGKISYTIYISCGNYGDFVTIPHKKERVVAKKRNKNIVITSIDYIGEYECQCISVDHDNCLYIADEYTVTHNTALAMNIAEHAANAGHKVMIFSLEMDKHELAHRMLSGHGRVDSEAMRKGYVTEVQWKSLTRSAGTLSQLPVVIDDTSGISLTSLTARAKVEHLKGKIGLIIVDYLQLMQCKGAGSREAEIAAISRGLKGLAKDLSVPVIALSQLNRKLEERTDRRPLMSDLRESGAIEQDADIVAFIYRDVVYNEKSPFPELAEIITRKQRGGPSGTDKLRFEGQYSRFYEYSAREEI